jgi:hypothetical protein
MFHVHIDAVFHDNAAFYVCVHVHVCRNAGMPDCPVSDQSGTGLKKTNNRELVWYRTKLTQSGIFLVRYWTKIRDAGIPMQALVSSMPTPSYGWYVIILAICIIVAHYLLHEKTNIDHQTVFLQSRVRIRHHQRLRPTISL